MNRHARCKVKYGTWAFGISKESPSVTSGINRLILKDVRRIQ